MSFLKSYVLPAAKKDRKNSNDAEKQAAPASATDFTAPITPTMTPGRTSMASRPSSIFPQGDFRNTNRGNVLGVKSAVMVSWLHQQQREKSWAHDIPGEGVVLKMSKDNYTCYPPALRNDDDGFFHQVVAMNVRVSCDVQNAPTTN